METKDFKNTFNQETAAKYDVQRDKLAPIKDALHLCMQSILTDLPETARVLCVGAGTGSELIYLAKAFPKWQFTIVEPSIPMMDVCIARAKELNIFSRCTFHEGYLDSLPTCDEFDVATSILVSHFIVDAGDRAKFFTEIASRLKTDGYMINADLAFDMSSVEYDSLLQVWVNMHKNAGLPVRVESFGKKVALLPRGAVETLLKSSGFTEPVLFFQTLFIHAWYSKANLN